MDFVAYVMWKNETFLLPLSYKLSFHAFENPRELETTFFGNNVLGLVISISLTRSSL